MTVPSIAEGLDMTVEVYSIQQKHKSSAVSYVIRVYVIPLTSLQCCRTMCDSSQVTTGRGEKGVIEGSFGKSGKLKVRRLLKLSRFRPRRKDVRMHDGCMYESVTPICLAPDLMVILVVTLGLLGVKLNYFVSSSHFFLCRLDAGLGFQRLLS